MNRREIIAAFGGASVAWPLMSRAQQQATPVIGVLGITSPEQDEPASWAAFREGLRETEHIEGEGPPAIDVAGLNRDVAQAFDVGHVGSDHRSQRVGGLNTHRTQRGGVVDGARHVDRVVEPDVRVAPEALQRFVHPRRVSAGTREDLVHRHHRPPCGPYLGAATNGPLFE